MHPNGQIPAYEWNFGDVNPAGARLVHVSFTYSLELAKTGKGDKEWLKSNFQKLLLNFTWWVNRKDRSGRNVFEGGFLGLDNIGVFDRKLKRRCRPAATWSRPTAPPGWRLFCQNMLEIANGIGQNRRRIKCRHVGQVCSSTICGSHRRMAHMGDDTGMWDEEDGFFYDVLQLAQWAGPKAQGAVDGRAVAAVRCFDL